MISSYVNSNVLHCAAQPAAQLTSARFSVCRKSVVRALITAGWKVVEVLEFPPPEAPVELPASSVSFLVMFW